MGMWVIHSSLIIALGWERRGIKKNGGERVSKWTDEVDQRLLELRKTLSQKDTAKQLTKEFPHTYSRNAVKNRESRIQIEKPVENRGFKETIEIKSDGTQISDKLIELSEKEMKDTKYILLAHGYDPSKWEVINVKISHWHYRDKQSENAKISYATKLMVKPKKYEFTQEEARELVLDLMKDYQPPTFKPTRYSADGKLLELNISDLHLNKLGYKEGEYDHKQAEEAFFFIINDVLTRTAPYKFEKILFIWSHDFFNVDNLTKTTTAGTPQDVDMRYADMYKKGKRMLIQGIDLLKQFAPVETVLVGANHDNLTSYTMSEVLDAWFRNDDNVTIDNIPLQRKYIRFGKSLIGFSHGDKEKKRLGKLPAIEARKDWGEVEYVEMHAAHLHSEQAVVEDNGVIIRYLSSPSGTDKWHFESGYVGAVRKAQSFIWDKECGLTDVLHSIIPKREAVMM